MKTSITRNTVKQAFHSAEQIALPDGTPLCSETNLDDLFSGQQRDLLSSREVFVLVSNAALLSDCSSQTKIHCDAVIDRAGASLGFDRLLQQTADQYRKRYRTPQTKASVEGTEELVRLAALRIIGDTPATKMVGAIIDDFEATVMLNPETFVPYADFAATMRTNLRLDNHHPAHLVLGAIIDAEHSVQTAESRRAMQGAVAKVQAFMEGTVMDPELGEEWPLCEKCSKGGE